MRAHRDVTKLTRVARASHSAIIAPRARDAGRTESASNDFRHFCERFRHASTSTEGTARRSLTTPGSVIRRVVTAFGPDREGIVSEVAQVVLRHGGSVEESRMARLRGDFTMTMLVAFAGRDGERVNVIAFENALDAIENITSSVRASTETVDESGSAAGVSHRRVLLRGTDFPGITHAFARALFDRGMNIESMSTDTAIAPFGNERLFLVDALVRLPANADAALDEGLRALERDMGLDVEILEHDPVGKMR